MSKPESNTQENTQAQLDANAELEAMKVKLAQAEADRDAAREQAAKAEEDVKKAEAEMKKSPKAKPVKTTTVRVVSKTEYSYLIDGVRVTPDVPVSLERREGNLLDCQMKAGLIGEYE